MVKNCVTAEVSASAMPSDVVGAIMDSAIENRRREKMTWLDHAKQITWGQAAMLALFCLGVAVLALTMITGGPDVHAMHEQEYHALEQAHKEVGVAFDDPDEDFADDLEMEGAEEFDPALAMDIYGDYEMEDTGHSHQPAGHAHHRPHHHNTKGLHLGHRKGGGHE